MIEELAERAYARAGVADPRWDDPLVRAVYQFTTRAVVLALADDIEAMLNRLGQEALIRSWAYDPASEFWQRFDRLSALVAEVRAVGDADPGR